MFIFLTLEMVLFTHLLQIGVVMMALATVWGLALIATRPATPATSASIPAAIPPAVADQRASSDTAPAAPRELVSSGHRFSVPQQSGERDTSPAGQRS